MAHEFDGRKYQQASTHQKEWGAKLIGELSISGSERILDLGCGDGALTARLADLVPHGAVVGMDASRGMIEAARSHNADNLSFLVSDINDLHYENEFDIVFSNAALHWVKDHDTLLGNTFRALRPGGVLRFNFAGGGNCANFFRVVKELMVQSPFENDFARFEWPWFMPTVAEYEELIKRFSFREIRVWGENADRSFADQDAMTKWLDQPSLVPFMAVLAEQHRREFRDRVVSRMIDETRQDDGTCFETFRRINVFAVK